MILSFLPHSLMCLICARRHAFTMSFGRSPASGYLSSRQTHACGGHARRSRRSNSRNTQEIHAVTHNRTFPQKLFPPDWTAQHSSPISIGPYYCVGAFVFFVIVGLLGMIYMCCTQCNEPSGQTHRTRRHQQQSIMGSSECNNCLLACNICENTSADCCCCCLENPCSGCTAEEGAGAMLFLVVLLVSLLALFGIFVTFFFGTVSARILVPSVICLSLCEKVGACISPLFWQLQRTQQFATEL